MRVLLACLLLTGCGSAVAIPDDALEDASADSNATADAASDTTAKTDASRADSPIGATDGGRPLLCSDPSTFPKFIKGCGTTENCSFGLHQIDCCGSKVAIGFNHSERTRFDEIEKAWQSTCPACDCREKPTLAEDGKTGTTFGVACVEGQCRTFVR